LSGHSKTDVVQKIIFSPSIECSAGIARKKTYEKHPQKYMFGDSILLLLRYEHSVEEVPYETQFSVGVHR
jgi:hypothetical protein